MPQPNTTIGQSSSSPIKHSPSAVVLNPSPSQPKLLNPSLAETQLRRGCQKKIRSLSKGSCGFQETSASEQNPLGNIEASVEAIISFVKSNEKNPKRLVHLYNLALIADESTRKHRNKDLAVELFRNNLTEIILKLLYENNPTSKNEATLLANSLLYLGKHRHETTDNIKQCFFFSCNTDSINRVKNFIKEKIYQNQNSTKYLKKLQKSLHVKKELYFFLDKYIKQFLFENENSTPTEKEKFQEIITNFQQLKIESNANPSNEINENTILSLIQDIKKYRDKNCTNRCLYMRLSVLQNKIIQLCKIKKLNNEKSLQHEITMMQNFIHYNNLSANHAAKYNLNKFNIYKNMIETLKKNPKYIDSSQLDPISENIEKNIIKQKSIINYYSNFKIAKEKDFNFHLFFEKKLKKLFRHPNHFDIAFRYAEAYINAKEFCDKDTPPLKNEFFVPYNKKGNYLKLNRESPLLYPKTQGESEAEKNKPRFLFANTAAGRNMPVEIQKLIKIKAEAKFKDCCKQDNEIRTLSTPLNINYSLAKGAISNPISINILNDKNEVITSQFQCGAIYSQLSAKQYVAYMIAENLSQIIAQGKLILVDSRQLKNSIFDEGEREYLELHRKFVEKEIDKINKLIAKFTHNEFLLRRWFGQSGVDVNKENIDLFFTKIKEKKIEKIEFYSSNFSAYSSATKQKTPIKGVEAVGGIPCSRTKKSLQNLLNYYKNNSEEIISQFNNDDSKKLFHLRLKDLESILQDTKNYNRTLAGDDSLFTALTINSLLNVLGGKGSIACKNNKDRGSNATILKLITQSIFEYRKSKFKYDVEDLPFDIFEPRVEFLPSFANFKLKNEEERAIVRDIIWQNIAYLPTLLNSRVAGNKSFLAWLKPILEDAFGGIEESKPFIQFFKEFNIHSHKAEV